MNEFEIIERYFAPLAPGGLRDDAAVLEVPEGCELTVTSDTLNAGVHFPADAGPEQIAHKALRVNLSDLAAMGADPTAYQLNIAFPDEPETAWLESFTAALAADQEEFGIVCSGGDTTRTKGPLSVSITALGFVPEGRAVTRSGAKAGDLIVLTDPVGDAFIYYHNFILHNSKRGGEECSHFQERYYKPRPRVDLAEAVRDYAHAAIDMSDGLVADLGHVCAESGLAAVVEMEKIRFSEPARRLLDSGAVTPEDLLTGGDDYALLLAVPEESASQFPGAQVIGRFEAGSGVTVLDSGGEPLTFNSPGWRHF